MGTDTPQTPAPAKVYAGSLQKVADAYAMRIRGAEWATIAAAVGYANPQNAMRAVRNYVGRLPQPQMPELRSMWRDRLEWLWPIAARDVEAGKPGAMRAAVAVAQRAAQLDGIDAPQTVRVESADAAELAAMVAALLAANGGDVGELEASMWGGDDIEDAEVVDD
ncbi:hypothetical protein IF188_08035 [Microbacterium sp. NEAU-LLC]|uniref:Uncharacterized protein n=1 Tax=Microbacterium helvum TaxID=2773713 RepID=A0ABR8NMH3_9MICO|nr:hypothetical protein [Microbacterium helvum]MBD3941642.1 hypothetical protein [Microbacterium helvum]